MNKIVVAITGASGSIYSKLLLQKLAAIPQQWEAVLEGQVETPFSPSGPSSLAATGAFLKHVLRDGSLQDKTGPSIATEFGVLLPEVHDDSRFGASVAGIISQRFDWGTIHLNGAAALLRDQSADLFVSAIGNQWNRGYQRCLSHSLDLDPQPSFSHEDLDAFGNPIARLEYDRAHDRLAVSADMQVEVLPRSPDSLEATEPWENQTKQRN